ncbi:Solute carrier 2, facilitated glucose transporter member 3, variant 2 [Clonorchis sinensis]|uniref:Solute carrier 2, facilitated glucose transporter member 3, variant 2 n=1 Tax=Clonorchis sinensis TaxID=79923 RepID=A0A8T1MSS8_CLOSI|nr:Solute carrier 2, facilitated glucose transporter member 3, variant 2 [Clonorchis sinensis]
MLPARLIVMLLGITLATSFQYGYHSAVINQPLHFIADFIGNISESRYGVSNESYKTTVASICVTSFIVGGLVGALSSGTISNKLGRKKSILFLTIPCLLGTVLIMLDYLTRSFETIIIGRFLIGCSCGAYTAVAPIYLSEVTPVSLRGMGGVLNQVMIVISVVVSQILGLPSIMNTDVLWPYLLGINVVPCVVGAICLFFCPESPRYLYLAKKDITSAASALKSLRNNPEDVVKELDELAKELDVTSGKVSQITEPHNFRKAGVLDILRVPHLRLALLIALAAHCGQQLSGMNGLLFYSVELFKSNGLSAAAANYATTGIGCVLLGVTIISIFVIDRVGRRVLLIWGLCVVLTSLLIFTLRMIIKDAAHMSWLVNVAMASIYVFVCGFGVGAGSIPWFLVVEMFSQEYRDTATAIGVAVNWTCIIIIGLGFIQLIKYFGVYAFLPSACIEAIVILVLYKYMPETMGRTPMSIEAELKRKVAVNRASHNEPQVQDMLLKQHEEAEVVQLEEDVTGVFNSEQKCST